MEEQQRIVKAHGIVHDEITKENKMTEFDVITSDTVPYPRLILEWNVHEDGSELPGKVLDLKEIGLQEHDGFFLIQGAILQSWIDAALRSD